MAGIEMEYVAKFQLGRFTRSLWSEQPSLFWPSWEMEGHVRHESGWRDIIHAPMDGTPILAIEGKYDSEVIVIPVRWDQDERCWVWAWGQWPDETNRVNPIAWMPLPT